MAEKSVLGSVPIVVSQDATETLVAPDNSDGLSDFFACGNQTIAQSLVISLSMIMLKVLRHGSAHRSFPEEDHAIEALDF